MYLALNDEQRLLAQTVRSFIQKELPSSKVREIVATEDAFDEHLWQQMAEQGWMSVTVPSEFGGMADSWLTVAVLFEELGWGMAPGPFLATVGLAAPLLAAAGSAEQKSRWLSAIAEGNLPGNRRLSGTGRWLRVRFDSHDGQQDQRRLYTQRRQDVCA